MKLSRKTKIQEQSRYPVETLSIKLNLPFYKRTAAMVLSKRALFRATS